MLLRICHLYGDLLNTYGDNGNLLMLQYCAKQAGHQVETELISLGDAFDPSRYHLVMIGGGQDHEQMVIARDLPSKLPNLRAYIEQGGVMLAICGGYQLLGSYYETADGQRITGAGLLPHFTVHQKDNRFVGDVTIYNSAFDETYVGFENHNGRTFLGVGQLPLGEIQVGNGNNGEDRSEGAIYKNVFCSYFHGPLLVRNRHLAMRLIQAAETYATATAEKSS